MFLQVANGQNQLQHHWLLELLSVVEEEVEEVELQELLEAHLLIVIQIIVEE